MIKISAQSWLTIGALLATIATVGSLYFSELLGLTPCDLCWYQRVFMYPLVPLLGIAAFNDRPEIHTTAFTLTIPGAAIAAYHSTIQRLGGRAICTLDGGCTTIQYELFGLTIPNMAFLVFSSITMVVLAARTSKCR